MPISPWGSLLDPWHFMDKKSILRKIFNNCMANA